MPMMPPPSLQPTIPAIPTVKSIEQPAISQTNRPLPITMSPNMPPPTRTPFHTPNNHIAHDSRLTAVPVAAPNPLATAAPSTLTLPSNSTVVLSSPDRPLLSQPSSQLPSLHSTHAPVSSGSSSLPPPSSLTLSQHATSGLTFFDTLQQSDRQREQPTPNEVLHPSYSPLKSNEAMRANQPDTSQSIPMDETLAESQPNIFLTPIAQPLPSLLNGDLARYLPPDYQLQRILRSFHTLLTAFPLLIKHDSSQSPSPPKLTRIHLEDGIIYWDWNPNARRRRHRCIRLIDILHVRAGLSPSVSRRALSNLPPTASSTNPTTLDDFCFHLIARDAFPSHGDESVQYRELNLQVSSQLHRAEWIAGLQLLTVLTIAQQAENLRSTPSAHDYDDDDDDDDSNTDDDDDEEEDDDSSYSDDD